jgi:hypothetical protein
MGERKTCRRKELCEHQQSPAWEREERCLLEQMWFCFQVCRKNRRISAVLVLDVGGQWKENFQNSYKLACCHFNKAAFKKYINIENYHHFFVFETDPG